MFHTILTHTHKDIKWGDVVWLMSERPPLDREI